MSVTDECEVHTNGTVLKFQRALQFSSKHVRANIVICSVQYGNIRFLKAKFQSILSGFEPSQNWFSLPL